MSDDRDRLRRKLRRIDALHRGATTAGEREAAARARRRLRRRLGETPVIRDAGPKGTVTPESIGLPSEAPGASMPDRAELRDRLLRWRGGELSARGLGRWASRVVDRVLLPDRGPEDPASIPVEVLLQLSCMRHQPLTLEDLPALLAFLDAPPERTAEAWVAWFNHLEAVDWRARRSA